MSSNWDGQPSVKEATAAAEPEPKVLSDTFHLFPDGASWRAERPGFVDLQESPCGFGRTRGEAVDDLLAGEASTWRSKSAV